MTEQGNDPKDAPLFSGPRRTKRKPGARAMVGALLVHSLVFAPALIAAWGSEPPPPTYKVYRVKIKSPPPATLGEPAPAVAATPRPAPEPKPEPPKPEPPKPEPPKPTPPKPEPAKSTPPKPAPPKPEPAKPQPKPEPAKPSPTPTEPKKTESAPAREATPSRGANPKPGSPGGDNLDVDLDGEDFPDPAYLQNVIRQINNYFRWTGQTDLEVHVAFTINDDGSVSNLRVVRTSRNARFNLAALQAVEEAGKRKAFGALPDVWPRDILPVMFKFQPPK